ncbi:Ldh family oxidoreductase, partial [Streptomyces sp. NPDC002920]
MSTPPAKVLVPAEDLRTFSAALFEKGGLSAEHARTTADVLVWAALRGVDSHGVARVPAYLDLLEKGVANADARSVVESSTPALRELCSSASDVRDVAIRAGDVGALGTTVVCV